eukprot:TRINITY_DN28203_c0_g1_i1.p1 TRINITY_DN28203_c0_g1~~TRINITY_DN28203_c0_g1_i1.p1  ORF type:complete len:703 (+),score=200.48 TRINITY_DN28203_c0_g1_i1:63-2171(+)
MFRRTERGAPAPAPANPLHTAGFMEWGKQRRLRLYDRMKDEDCEQARLLVDVAHGGGVAALTKRIMDVEGLIDTERLTPDFVYRVGVTLGIAPLEALGERHLPAELRGRVARRLFIDSMFKFYSAYIAELTVAVPAAPFAGLDDDVVRGVLAFLPRAALPDLRLVGKRVYTLATCALAAHPLIDTCLRDEFGGGDVVCTEAGAEWYACLGDGLLPQARCVLAHLYRRHRREGEAVRAADRAAEAAPFDVAAVIPPLPLVPMFGFAARLLVDLRLGAAEAALWADTLVALWQGSTHPPSAETVLAGLMWLLSFEAMEPAARALTERALAAPWVVGLIAGLLVKSEAEAGPPADYFDAPLDEGLVDERPSRAAALPAPEVAAPPESDASTHELMAALCGPMMVGTGVPVRGTGGLQRLSEAGRQRVVAHLFARYASIGDTHALAMFLKHGGGASVAQQHFETLVAGAEGPHVPAAAVLCAAVCASRMDLAGRVLEAHPAALATQLAAPDRYGKTVLWYWVEAGADEAVLRRLVPCCRGALPSPMYYKPPGERAAVTVLLEGVLRSARRGAAPDSSLPLLLQERLVDRGYALYMCLRALHTSRPGQGEAVLDLVAYFAGEAASWRNAPLPSELIPPHLPATITAVAARCSPGGCMLYAGDSELGDCHCAALGIMGRAAALLEERARSPEGDAPEEEVLDDWEAYA